MVSVFGIGSMIHSGIEVGMFFELRLDGDTPCRNYFSLVRPILHLIYVFVQMYFVFLNQKVRIKIVYFMISYTNFISYKFYYF